MITSRLITELITTFAPNCSNRIGVFHKEKNLIVFSYLLHRTDLRKFNVVQVTQHSNNNKTFNRQNEDIYKETLTVQYLCVLDHIHPLVHSMYYT